MDPLLPNTYWWFTQRKLHYKITLIPFISMKKRKPSSNEPNREDRKRKLDFKRKKEKLFQPGKNPDDEWWQFEDDDFQTRP